MGLPPERHRRVASQVKHRKLECLRDDVVLELFSDTTQTNKEVAAQLGCTAKTVKKWRPVANLMTARVKVGNGVTSARVIVDIRLKEAV